MKDRIELSQRVVAARRNGDPGLEVVVGAPRQVLEIEPPAEAIGHDLEDLDDFGGDFLADTVAGDDGDVHGVSFLSARGPQAVFT